MDTGSERRQTEIDLSRREQWVVHHVMLDRIELERRTTETTDPPSIDAYRVFEELETGSPRFSRRERRCIEDELRRYADARDTPRRDRAVAEDVLERLQ